VELLTRFEEAGVRPWSDVVVYHDDAVTAALGWFMAARVLGVAAVRSLDGGFESWIEQVGATAKVDAGFEVPLSR
jgi:3-mercaptopyruvate sulfurtransferase SseA